VGVTTVKDVTHPPGEGWVHVSELRPLLAAMPALSDGDFRVRLPAENEGIAGDLARAFNQIADRNQHFAGELSRVTREVTRHGRLDERLSPGSGHGCWTASVESANTLIEALVVPAVTCAGWDSGSTRWSTSCRCSPAR
jgi:methyl-accepting chemotaxis protein